MKNTIEDFAIKLSKGIGSITSLYIHTIIFVGTALIPFVGINAEKVSNFLTAAVSLEAIYLSIFIQMTVNKNSSDIEEIQEDIEEIQEDVEEIQEDISESDQDFDSLIGLFENEGLIQNIESQISSIQKDFDNLKQLINKTKTN